MEVKFLKAGTGDAILIQNKGCNILVDGGDDTTLINKELQFIYSQGEKLDLLIITHHDDDHIAGVIQILNDVIGGKYGKEKDFIKRVIFNSPKLIKNVIDNAENETGDLSYKQANETERLLLKINTEWKNRGITIANDENIEFDNLKLKILAPQKSVLENYADEKKGALLSGGKKCDWETPLKSLERWVDDVNLDTDSANKCSVVIQLQYEKMNILLPGDVTQKEFSILLEKLYAENDNKPVLFDYIKLPHHGSHRNLSNNILRKIDCQNYIITTNGDSKLPDKRALLKILKSEHRNKNIPINFFFNYGELIPELCISSEELEKYNFKLIANNRDYGYCI